MSWLFLFIAGIFEVTWAVGLKMSHSFTQFWPSVMTVAGMAASFVFLAIALKHLPLGTAYAIWTGIGIVGTTIAGVIIFGEQMSALHIVCISCIAMGIIGLRVIGG